MLYFFTIIHRSICNLNIPQRPPGIRSFRFVAVKFPSPSSNAPHVRPTGWANVPGVFLFIYFYFYFFTVCLTGQDRFKTICCKYQLAFFILKLNKGTSYLHSFLVSHSVTNAISCLLNRSTFCLRSYLALVYERPNSPPSTVWCQIPTAAVVLKSNSLLAEVTN